MVGYTDLPELKIQESPIPESSPAEPLSPQLAIRAAWFEMLQLELAAQQAKQPFYLH
jgi:hypothetical protein